MISCATVEYCAASTPPVNIEYGLSIFILRPFRHSIVLNHRIMRKKAIILDLDNTIYPVSAIGHELPSPSNFPDIKDFRAYLKLWELLGSNQ